LGVVRFRVSIARNGGGKQMMPIGFTGLIISLLVVGLVADWVGRRGSAKALAHRRRGRRRMKAVFYSLR
jgi:hypothetical protein